ncbi:reduction in Cnn dots 6 [Brevipalpus obovatus]|uniref:reduction in Cnn dots 6 n=1 Tax=Brevipalpus obovatus TaxID=246614 RepID=UPI003D9E97E2
MCFKMKLCDRTASHMLSMIAAIYGIFIYAIAFSIEMWFIVTTPVSTFEFDPNGENVETIPVFAFLLAAIYFVTIIVSLLLMLGMIIKSIMCLMSWLITIVILFFPECGLVLFMSLEKWGVETRKGQIELCLFIVRAIMNIFFIICVQNLINQWRTDKQVTAYAMNLSSYHSNPQPDPFPFMDTNTTTINPVFKYNSALNGSSHMPTSEFDTRNFQDMIKTSPGCGSSDMVPYQSRYTTQSLDRRKLVKGRSSHSLKDEVILQPLHHHPFDYLNRPISNLDLRMPHFSNSYSRSNYMSRTLPRDFGDKNSSTHSIKDVAL